MATGKIVQVIGAVVDVEFPQDAVPRVYDALECKMVMSVWCWKFSSSSAAVSYVPSQWVPPTVCVAVWM
ncbi:hypothetical protein ECZU31_52480 [Escherichia coli]|nr:hypothetical protein ECZU31_52480 [Escherichia coli]